VGLLPHSNDIPAANLVLGLLGLTSTAGLIVRLWRARSGQKLSQRWPVLLALTIAMYAGQTAEAFTSTTTRPPGQQAPHSSCSFSLSASRDRGNCSACAATACSTSW